MTEALIVLTVLLFMGQTLSMKWVKADLIQDKLLVNGGSSFLAAALMLLYGLFDHDVFAISQATLLFGLLFGVLFSGTVFTYLLALSKGPLSYTALYFSASMLIPALAGMLLFGEAATPLKVIALPLFLFAFFLINVSPGQNTSRQRGWLPLCFLTFLMNGCLALTQKCQQNATGGTEAFGLMLVGFSTAAICYFIVFLCVKPKNDKSVLPFSKNTLAIPLLAICSMLGNVLLTRLAGQVESGILFPVVQGGIMLTVSLASMLFFKEKPSKQGIIGLLAGLCAIVLISL